MTDDTAPTDESDDRRESVYAYEDPVVLAQVASIFRAARIRRLAREARERHEESHD
ncbi:MAG: hypothetical protein ACRDP8_10140 [Actinopolymorphaceae bacterium]